MKIHYSLVVSLFILILPISVFAQKGKSSQPDFAAGVRLGDPSGISLKKYFNNNAHELSIGRSYLFYGGPGYYDRRFDKWYKDWYRDYPTYKEVHYVGYARSFPISFQLHYLFQKELKGVDNLKWYWGLGPQLRYQTYYLDYEYKLEGNPRWIRGRERVSDIDLGIDGVAGLEYQMADLPISFFGDVTVFMEVADNPFTFWLQGGIGVRYNF
jgi:hypothetical protein